MALKEMPKVGDKVRYIDENYYTDATTGKVYEVYSVGLGEFSFVEDENDVNNRRHISESNFDKFELVTDDDSPTITDILANLALRISELERHNREQAYEINELYKEVSR